MPGKNIWDDFRLKKKLGERFYGKKNFLGSVLIYKKNYVPFLTQENNFFTPKIYFNSGKFLGKDFI